MHFIKMHGCGNDYIFVDLNRWRMETGDKTDGELARKMSDRHFGIGADGVIAVGREGKQFRMVMYNADGSRGEMCGNGIRCAAAYCIRKGWTRERSFTIRSANRAGMVTILSEDCSDFVVGVNLGRALPLGETVSDGSLPGVGTITGISMGNPHGVVLTEDAASVPVEELGPVLERITLFPQGANIEFVTVVDPQTIVMRVWERGSGVTLACGSGACAAAAVCMQKGLTNDAITVKLLGGDLQVSRDKEGDMILTGPAVTVFEGEYGSEST